MPNVFPNDERRPIANEHCLEYALIFGLQPGWCPLVYGTENMNDTEVLLFLRRNLAGLHPIAIWKLSHSDLRGGAYIGVTIRRIRECCYCRIPSPCPHLKGSPYAP